MCEIMCDTCVAGGNVPAWDPGRARDPSYAAGSVEEEEERTRQVLESDGDRHRVSVYGHDVSCPCPV